MVFDVAFIVFPQALPRGGVEDEGEGLERNGDADVQISVDHVVIEDTGALFPAEGAPEQTGGVDAGPEDERWGDETCQREENISNSGSGRESTAEKVFLSPAVHLFMVCWETMLDHVAL